MASVTYLIVGGGGGGGAGNFAGGGGGGSGGEVKPGSMTVTPGSYPIVIGDGGGGDTDGQDTTGLGLTAIGGGFGGYAGTPPVGTENGGTGAYGGGGGASDDTGGTNGHGGNGIIAFGGGSGQALNNASTSGGGGGGAGADGTDANSGDAGNGGIGVFSSILGVGDIAYGGGGGGGQRGSGTVSGIGGDGGGGNGGNGNHDAQNGAPAGSGGGGGGSGGGSTQGHGAQGQVIVRYPVGTFGASSGGIVTRVTVGGIDYVVHQFLTSDSLVLGSTGNFFTLLMDEGHGNATPPGIRGYGPEIILNGGFVGNADNWDLAEGGIAFEYASNAVHLPADLDDSAIMWQVMGEITQDALYHYSFDVQYIISDQAASSLDFYLGTESGGEDLVFVTNIAPNGGITHYKGDINVPFEDVQETWLYSFIFSPGTDPVSPNLILTNCSLKIVL